MFSRLPRSWEIHHGNLPLVTIGLDILLISLSFRQQFACLVTLHFFPLSQRAFLWQKRADFPVLDVKQFNHNTLKCATFKYHKPLALPLATAARSRPQLQSLLLWFFGFSNTAITSCCLLHFFGRWFLLRAAIPAIRFCWLFLRGETRGWLKELSNYIIIIVVKQF